MRVIRYLKTIKMMKAVINKEKDPVLTVYAAADWANDKFDIMSSRNFSSQEKLQSFGLVNVKTV